MGQTHSVNILPDTVDILREGIMRNAKILTEISGMSYDEFLKCLSELNSLSKRCSNTNDQIVFAVKKGTDSTILWKGTVRIACAKMDAHTKKVSSYKLFNLIEFLRLFNTLQTQMQIMLNTKQSTEASTSHTNALSASLLFREIGFEDEIKINPEKLGECCICLERKSEVMLPCAHSYCLPCIEQWNVNHKTCPLCRETLQSTDDTWVIYDKPEAEEINAEIRTTLLSFSTNLDQK